MEEKEVKSNPKLAAGSRKQGFQNIPPSSLIHLAQAMDDGAKKYGQMNWRESEVIASIYLDAAMRHILSYSDGEEADPISKVHHLGHCMACCAIVLDAIRMGNLVDDRHIPGDFGDFIRGLEQKVSL
jgi:hypothetical protein